MSDKKIVLTFPPQLTEVPIVYRLVKDYDLVLNILRAEVRENEAGKMVVELTGEDELISKGIEYLRNKGLSVKDAELDIVFDEKKCSSCGACVPHCAVEALSIDKSDFGLRFDREACVLCGRCVTVCPLRLFELTI